jgi:hypothetical protein
LLCRLLAQTSWFDLFLRWPRGVKLCAAIFFVTGSSEGRRVGRESRVVLSRLAGTAAARSLVAGGIKVLDFCAKFRIMLGVIGILLGCGMPRLFDKPSSMNSGMVRHEYFASSSDD